MATTYDLLVDEPVMGEEMYLDENPIGAKPKLTVKYADKPEQNPSTAAQAAPTPAPQTYEEMFRALSGYTPQTKEEIEKEQKKRKRDEMFSAIGDGIMALSNLYFTSKGAPNMYDGKNTLSGATKARYDKLTSDREAKNAAYYAGLMRARMADKEDSHRERMWQRQLGLDQKEQERYAADRKYREERDRIGDERYAAEQEYRQGKDEEELRRWQANFDENKRQADQNYRLGISRINASANAKGGKGGSGKKEKVLQFIDTKGNPIPISKDIWQTNLHKVFNAILEDFGKNEYNPERYRKNMTEKKFKTLQEKEDFVMTNWRLSEKAQAAMLELSRMSSGDELGWGAGGDDGQSEEQGEEW